MGQKAKAVIRRDKPWEQHYFDWCKDGCWICGAPFEITGTSMDSADRARFCKECRSHPEIGPAVGSVLWSTRRCHHCAELDQIYGRVTRWARNKLRK